VAELQGGRGRAGPGRSPWLTSWARSWASLGDRRRSLHHHEDRGWRWN